MSVVKPQNPQPQPGRQLDSLGNSSASGADSIPAPRSAVILHLRSGAEPQVFFPDSGKAVPPALLRSQPPGPGPASGSGAIDGA